MVREAVWQDRLPSGGCRDTYIVGNWLYRDKQHIFACAFGGLRRCDARWFCDGAHILISGCIFNHRKGALDRRGRLITFVRYLDHHVSWWYSGCRGFVRCRSGKLLVACVYQILGLVLLHRRTFRNETKCTRLYYYCNV